MLLMYSVCKDWFIGWIGSSDLFVCSFLTYLNGGFFKSFCIIIFQFYFLSQYTIMTSCSRMPRHQANTINTTHIYRDACSSSPILIPVQKSPTSVCSWENGVNKQCELKESVFDPSKFSPPQRFLLKLQMRMGSYACPHLGINDISRNSE